MGVQRYRQLRSYRNNELEVLTGVRLLHDDVKVFPPEDLMRRQIMLRRYRQRIQFVILKSRENVLGYELGEKGGHLVALIKLNGLFGKIERLNIFNARSLRSTVNSSGGLPRQLSI
jgi:hypothetical protein